MRRVFSGTSRDGAGNVVSSATVKLFEAGGTTAATFYSSATSTAGITSTTSGSDGSFSIYVDNFDYDAEQTFKITIEKAGYSTKTTDNVRFDDVVLGTYSISADRTVTTNLVVPKGVIYSIATGKTLTISGSFSAGDYQVFSGAGSVTGLRNPRADWFPLTAAGLQQAIDSTADTYGQSVIIPTGVTVDIGSSTVTLRKGTQIKGESRYTSKITMADGSISYGTYAAGVNRYKTLENLTITNSGTTSKTVDMGQGADASTYGPYEDILKDCNVSGGKYAVYVDNVAIARIEGSDLQNDVADDGIYALYVNSSKQGTSVKLSANRYRGKVVVGYGSTGFPIVGVDVSCMNIFESSYDYAAKFDNIQGLNLTGAYFETSADLQPAYIGTKVYGGSVTGSNFTPNSGAASTAVPLTVEGQGIDIRGNSFNMVGTQAAIHLTSNSRRCVVGVNDDYQVNPYVLNEGSQNSVFPEGMTTSRMTTQALTSGVNTTALWSPTFMANSLRVNNGLHIEGTGVITGTNDAKYVYLTLGEGTPITMLTAAAGVSGTYNFRAWVEAVSLTSQKISWELKIGSSKYFGYATESADMALTAKRKIVIQAKCDNAGDSVSLEMGSLKHQ